VNLEHRLQHAARELREVRIETPPLDGQIPSARSGSLRRIPALVAPVLFTLGGLVMVSGGLRSETPTFDSPPATGAVVTSRTAETGSTATRTTSPIEELRLISSLVAEIEPPADSTADRPVARPGPVGVV
jgi:hypothetical protein